MANVFTTNITIKSISPKQSNILAKILIFLKLITKYDIRIVTRDSGTS